MRWESRTLVGNEHLRPFLEPFIMRWEIDRVEESIMRWKGRTQVGNEHLRPFLESEQLRFLRSNWGSSTVRATKAFQRREKSSQPSSIRPSRSKAIEKRDHREARPSRSSHQEAAIEHQASGRRAIKKRLSRSGYKEVRPLSSSHRARHQASGHQASGIRPQSHWKRAIEHQAIGHRASGRKAIEKRPSREIIKESSSRET